jgi:glycosyltransferase involved in cell wall biosynthesis
MKKRHLVMALPTVRGGTIGKHAIARAKVLSDFYRVTVVSDVFPDVVPEEIRCVRVFPRKFDYLRRFCHVPNEVAFACAVRTELARLQHREPIDFLLCHGYTLTTFAGRYLHSRHGIHYGMFMHGHIFTRPGGTYDCRLTAFYRWIAPVCYREAHLVFALSPDQIELAVKAGAAADRVVLAPNGIRRADVGICSEDINPAGTTAAETRRLRILYVGRLSVEKGVDTLLAACEFLTEWKVNYFLTIVGDGPCGEELSHLVERYGIAKSVKFVGAIPREHLGKYYLATDILCVPSLDEPLGNVVLEGLVSGCLVLGSEVGGIRFIISDAVDGYLVPPAKPEKWAAKLKFVSENRSGRDVLVESAREMVGRRFCWEKIARDIHEAVSRVVVKT